MLLFFVYTKHYISHPLVLTVIGPSTPVYYFMIEEVSIIIMIKDNHKQLFSVVIAVLVQRTYMQLNAKSYTDTEM